MASTVSNGNDRSAKMASTVSNGNDRSEKWHRQFQMATTVYEREICVADVLKLGRNTNRIGAIFNRFISAMDRIVLLECHFSPALVLVMRD